MNTNLKKKRETKTKIDREDPRTTRKDIRKHLEVIVEKRNMKSLK